MKDFLFFSAKAFVFFALYFIGISASLKRGDAATISISNYNFETGGYANDANSSLTIPTGWSAVNGGISYTWYGYYNPNNDAYTGTTGNNVIGKMDGPNVFYFGEAQDGQGIFQSLSSTFQVNTDYALTVASGARNSLTYMASLEMQLFAGSTLIANQVIKNTTPGTFQDFTLNYIANSSNNYLAGQNLKIQFLERDFGVNDKEVDIDNVRLTSSVAAIPEPSTYLLFAMGVAAIVFGRRCRLV